LVKLVTESDLIYQVDSVRIPVSEYTMCAVGNPRFRNVTTDISQLCTKSTMSSHVTYYSISLVKPTQDAPAVANHF